MGLITRSELLEGFQNRTKAEPVFRVKTASQILTEESKRFSASEKYTIFLSHSFRDAAIVLELKRLLESLGYSVYVDWIEDPQLDRSKITKETAAIIKQRMITCECLFYATTENSSSSKWMPWECGFMDGKKDKVAILPIAETSAAKYNGQEYLALYPYVDKNPSRDSLKMKLWINEDPSTYVEFDNWLRGEKPKKRSA